MNHATSVYTHKMGTHTQILLHSNTSGQKHKRALGSVVWKTMLLKHKAIKMYVRCKDSVCNLCLEINFQMTLWFHVFHDQDKTWHLNIQKLFRRHFLHISQTVKFVIVKCKVYKKTFCIASRRHRQTKHPIEKMAVRQNEQSNHIIT